MRIFATIAGVLLILLGAVLLLDALTHSIGINLLSPNADTQDGNGVLGIAVGAVPLVIGLIILSKLQQKQDPPGDDPPSE